LRFGIRFERHGSRNLKGAIIQVASNPKPSDLGWPTPDTSSPKPNGKPSDLGWPTK
jgi:hypothetical protein